MDKSDKEEILLDLYDDPEGRGEVNFDQDPLLHKRENSGFVITARQLYEVHGEFEGNDAEKASLLVIKFTMSRRPDDTDRQYKSLRFTLRFEATPKGDPIDDPWIIAFAPAQKGAVYVTENTVKVVDSHSLEGNTKIGTRQAAPAAVSGGMKAMVAKCEKYSQRYLYEVHAESDQSTEKGEGRQGENIVWWDLRAHPTKTDGDSLAVSMLLRRPNSSKFVIHLTVSAKVDLKYAFAERWKRLKKVRYSPLGPFDPSQPNKEIPAGVVKERLHDVSTDETRRILENLAFLHVPEKLAPKAFYGDAGERRDSASPENNGESPQTEILL
jgi:hypothetical protein